jgi:hypothetical protein
MEFRDGPMGNIFTRQMWFGGPTAAPGGVVPGHGHNFPHVTYFPKGNVLAEKLDNSDNVIRSVVKRASDGFNWLQINAGVRHRFTALPCLELSEPLLRQALARAGMAADVIDKTVTASQANVNALGHCIYAHRTPQGEVVQEYDGWSPAYL